MFRNLGEALGAVAKTVERCAAIGLLVVAAWDDDDPVAHDPLLSD